MSFVHPVWLLVAACLAAAGAAFLRAVETRRRRDLERFVSGPLLVSLTASAPATHRHVRGGVLLTALVLGCVSLARPVAGFQMEESRQRGTDVVFAVDVSRSMLARDVKPDRLTRAKLGVLDLVERIGGDRVGLVAFAGSAFLQAPLTADHAAFREALDALDPDVIPRGGTDVGAALHEAEAAFRTAPEGSRIVVLLSDGEDLEGNARVAAGEAAQRGIRLYTVGVGTPAGESIPLDAVGERGQVTDGSGNPVVSRLDEEGLRAMAETTGGFYVPLGARAEGLEAIREQVLATAPKTESSARSTRVPIERFQWPLGLALALVLGEALALESARRAARPSRRTAGAAIPAGVLAATMLLASATPARAGAADGERAYAEGRYEEALSHWKAAGDAAPSDARLRFNAGTAAYRAGRHDEAAEAFRGAIEHGDPALQQRAYYDLGNARFRAAEVAAQQTPEEARKAFDDAIRAYDGALALDPGDADARFNRDLAKARRDALQPPPPQDSPQPQEQEGKAANDSQPQEQDGKGANDSQPQGGGADSPPQGGDAKSSSPPQGGDGGNPAPSGEEQASASPHPGSRAEAPQPQAGDARSGAKPADETATQESPGGDAPKDAQPERADGREESARPESGARRPGEMSAREAAQLLDSLRGDETRAPRASAGRSRGGAGGENDEPIRNW